MFERVIHADWVNSVPPIAFACFAIAFAMVLFRALTLPKHEIDRIAKMPLDDHPNRPDRTQGADDKPLHERKPE